MPDSTREPDELDGGSSSAGPRRSGLDRLRAARGGAPAPAGSASTERAERPASADRGDVDRGTGRGSGSTALLEPGDPDLDAPDLDDPELDQTDVGEADGDTDLDGSEVDGSDVDETDGGATDVRSGRGSRSRGPAAKAADTGRAATREGATGRAGTTGRRSATGAGATGAEPAGSKAAGSKATGTKATRGKAADRRAGAARPAPRLQIAAVVVLALLVIGLAIPVVAMRHRIFGQSADAKSVSNLVETRADAGGAARRFAATFFTTDYKTIDQYADQVAALSTGAFLADFNSKRADLKSLTTQAQSQATVRVLASGVSKVSGDNVEVLVVADQTVATTATKGKAPAVQRYRVRITVQKTPKGWLVTALEPVG